MTELDIKSYFELHIKRLEEHYSTLSERLDEIRTLFMERSADIKADHQACKQHCETTYALIFNRLTQLERQATVAETHREFIDSMDHRQIEQAKVEAHTASWFWLKIAGICAGATAGVELIRWLATKGF